MGRVLLGVLFAVLLMAAASKLKTPELPVSDIVSAAQGVGQTQSSRNN